MHFDISSKVNTFCGRSNDLLPDYDLLGAVDLGSMGLGVGVSQGVDTELAL